MIKKQKEFTFYFYESYIKIKCGRKFENGFMIDDGGTTIDEEE